MPVLSTHIPGSERTAAKQSGWLLTLLGITCLLVPQASFAQKKPRIAPDRPVSTTVIDNGAIAQPTQKSDKVVAEETEFTDAYRFLLVDEPTKAVTALEKMLQKNPANAAVNYALATALIKAGKATDAFAYAQKAYQLNPTNAYYLLQVAELYVKQKRYADAEVLYEELLTRGVESMEYGVELAAIYLFDDKPDKALATYDRVEKAMGLNEEITRQKQRIYLKQNKIDKAIEEAERLIASEPADPDFLIEGAELLIANERVPLAVTWLERALKLNPDDPQAHMLLADVYRKQGNMDKSGQELQKVFANPNLEAGMKARILSSYVGVAGDTPTAKQDALKMAQSLVAQSPGDAKAQVMLADLLMQQGQKAEARDAYVKAAKADPSVYEVWGAIIEIDSDLAQIDSVLSHSEKALEVFPSQGKLWYVNGSAHLYKRHYQQAVDALDEARKLLTTNPQFKSSELQGQLGDAYNGLGDYARSNEAFEAALKADPQNDRVLNNYSYFLSLRKENLPKARAMSTLLAERHPTNATYLDTHAWVLYVMKDYAAARQFLEKAVQSDPANVSGTILEHYGDVLFQLGEKDKALIQWKVAKQKGETSERLERKIAAGKLYE
ncbi:tetratricopeptide repeat protein [Fibrella aquatilis]|uniref:Tetratricopeptide repeat protein n=1 Tax=Fibrella aquatilis TaxID=2817059 RepID=A0A939G5D5_9BACT|nr:tetratricopeptide repeat protein [Fibrella aquatilis]MBO0932191.1 tetratricopeptide repeat protein [Fibrella aquatilis]